MTATIDRHGDNRWNQCQDTLIALWNRLGPDATLGALRDLELGTERLRDPFAGLERYPVDLAACPHCDSPYGTVHGPGCPYDPEPDAKSAATREAG